jgi:ABC-type transport system involved in multi-copper enzyme maturation permease subunit
VFWKVLFSLLFNCYFFQRSCFMTLFKSGWKTVGILGMFIGLFAVGGAFAQVAVSGTITATTGGSAISGASVQLKASPAGTAVGSPVLTNATGAYSIASVAAGDYTIEVSATGYTTKSTAEFTVAAIAITGKDLDLATAPSGARKRSP